MEAIDPIAIARMLLIYVHVLAIAAAAAAVAFGDFAIFARPRIDRTMLETASWFASIALAALWISGLTMIVIDIGFDLAQLLDKPKLLAKLTVVMVLTANSLALHWVAFPRFYLPQADALRAATLPAVFGAVSATSWIYAAFVGVAKPLSAVLGYGGFIGLFALLLLGAIALALVTVRPCLASRMGSVQVSGCSVVAG